MSDSLNISTGEVVQLADVFTGAADVALADVRAVVGKGALNIKKDAQRRVTGLRHAPAYPRSIGYDTGTTKSSAWAEVGPDKDKRQGALGNIIEYGEPKHSTAPHPHMLPATEAELPRFEAAIVELAVKALGL